MLHIYYGNGKGKTCSAIGAAVRAAGNGFRVLVVQLFKASATGERSILSGISGIELYPCPKELKFTFEMNESELESERGRYERTLEYIKDRRKQYDMIVIDEFFTLSDCGFFTSSYLYNYIKEINKNNTEILLTGHDVELKFISLSDYATKFECIKHPFSAGAPPRAGVEM